MSEAKRMHRETLSEPELPETETEEEKEVVWGTSTDKREDEVEEKEVGG